MTPANTHPYAVLPLVTPISLTRGMHAHEVDWARSDGRVLLAHGPSGLPDAEVTVSLAGCRRCDTPLLLVSRCDDESGYLVAFEVLGTGGTASQ